MREQRREERWIELRVPACNGDSEQTGERSLNLEFCALLRNREKRARERCVA